MPTFIATGPGSWGKAKSIEAAERTMARHYGRDMPRCWTVHEVHESAFVNSMGQFEQEKGNTPPKLVKRRGFTTSDDVG
jgi:hypothetical protein